MTRTKGSSAGRLRRGLSRFVDPESSEAQELQRGTARAGCTRIAEAGDRQRVTLRGTIRTVTLRPRGGVPALEAEFYDGSGTVTLVWLGRRRIAGVEPGRTLRLEGRMGSFGGVPTIFNPRYELQV